MYKIESQKYTKLTALKPWKYAFKLGHLLHKSKRLFLSLEETLYPLSAVGIAKIRIRQFGKNSWVPSPTGIYIYKAYSGVMRPKIAVIGIEIHGHIIQGVQKYHTLEN